MSTPESNLNQRATANAVASSAVFGDWRPIDTAPIGKFLVWLPNTNLPWPASRHDADSEVFSNAHGVLNRKDDKWSPKATHWMPLPLPPNAPAMPTASDGRPLT